MKLVIPRKETNQYCSRLILNDLNTSTSIIDFRSKIRKWKPVSYPRRLCKPYIAGAWPTKKANISGTNSRPVIKKHIFQEQINKNFSRTVFWCYDSQGKGDLREMKVFKVQFNPYLLSVRNYFWLFLLRLHWLERNSKLIWVTSINVISNCTVCPNTHIHIGRCGRGSVGEEEGGEGGGGGYRYRNVKAINNVFEMCGYKIAVL